MFNLTTIQDVIQIEPNDFGKASRAALEDNINQQYANKVIQQVGLGICMYDLLSASDGLIGHGSGTVNVNVVFRLLVFRPFAGEIIEAKIISATAHGMRVGLEFFDDITVPAPGALFEPSRLEREGGVATWVWTNEGTPYYFDRNERVRLRVEDEIWQDQAPGQPDASGAGSQPGTTTTTTTATTTANGDAGEAGEGELERARAAKSPWRIVGSMQQGGLGVVSWWMDVEGDGEGDAAES